MCWFFRVKKLVLNYRHRKIKIGKLLFFKCLIVFFEIVDTVEK